MAKDGDLRVAGERAVLIEVEDLRHQQLAPELHAKDDRLALEIPDCDTFLGIQRLVVVKEVEVGCTPLAKARVAHSVAPNLKAAHIANCEASVFRLNAAV